MSSTTSSLTKLVACVAGPVGPQGPANKPTSVTSSLTAEMGSSYEVFASATFTDPSPSISGYTVKIRNGTATIGGTTYTEGVWWRVFHSGSWATYRLGFTSTTTAGIRSVLGVSPITDSVIVLNDNSEISYDGGAYEYRGLTATTIPVTAAGNFSVVNLTKYSIILEGSGATPPTTALKSGFGMSFTQTETAGEYSFSNVEKWQIQPLNSVSALTYTSTTALVFTSEFQRRTLVLTGDVIFTGSGYADGYKMKLFISGGASTRALTFPSGWVFLGTKPTVLASGKEAVFELECISGVESGVRCEWKVQT